MILVNIVPSLKIHRLLANIYLQRTVKNCMLYTLKKCIFASSQMKCNPLLVVWICCYWYINSTWINIKQICESSFWAITIVSYIDLCPMLKLFWISKIKYLLSPGRVHHGSKRSGRWPEYKYIVPSTNADKVNVPSIQFHVI